MKKIGIMITIFLLTAMVISGCQNAEQEAKEEDTVLSLGMMSSSDVIPFVMIKELGLDEEYGFTLNLETFTSAPDRDAALQAEELDGVISDYIGVTMYHKGGYDVRITGITDGDFILMAGKNTGIESLEEIDGQSIAISQNTLIEYSLDYILEEAGMSTDRVQKEVVARIPDRLELLRNEQIDLGLMPEPFATLALNDGATYIKSANDLGLYPSVSAFSMDSIEAKEEAVRKLYEAYNEAVAYINTTDIAEYDEIVIEAVGYPEEMLGQIEIGEYRENQLPPKEAIEKAIDWAVERDLTDENLTYEDITYDVMP